MGKHYLGYFSSGEQLNKSEQLINMDEIISFLKDHLYDKEVVIRDSENNLIFHAIDGTDVYSDLKKLGIDLQVLYQAARQNIVDSESPVDSKRETWEVDYDSFGLSLSEIIMRQQAKHACKAARTTADIAELLKGTYFEAYFTTEDEKRNWINFDPQNYSALDDKKKRTVFLGPSARVRYHSSGEDIHLFILLDPPKE